MGTMKISTLKCANCSAPLKVEADAKVTQCDHCQAYLAIESGESGLATKRLEKLEHSTATLSAELRDVQRDLALEKLDRQWKRDRMRYGQTGRYGEVVMPSREGANTVLVIGVLFAVVLWLTGTSLPHTHSSSVAFCTCIVGGVLSV